MYKPRTHTRIVQHPFAYLMQGARLDSYHENDHELHLNVQGFNPIESKLFEKDGRIFEQVQGEYIPLQLVFSNISKLDRDDFFTSLKKYPMDDLSRIIAFMLSWYQPKKKDVYYRFGLRGAVGADMNFFARKVSCEKEVHGKPITIERDWSPAPPMPDRLVPHPNYLYRYFGGDPITIKLNDRSFHRRLFIGGLDIQPKQRPQIASVLNLGEEPSRWIKNGITNPNDRAIEKGEGSQGMTLDEIRDEAEWALKKLKNDQSVLIHCVAGMNRSVTICCALLILLERLNAEDALARVREHHPWARPDSNHWLKLRWLADNK